MTVWNERLWRRVEEALDQRLDPFDDTALAAALEAEPGAADSARRLVQRLETLRNAGTRPPTARRLRSPLVLLGVAAALWLVFGALWRRDSAPEPVPAVPQGRGGGAGTVTLVVERLVPPPARGARVILEPRHVLAWSLEGVRQ